MSGRSIAGLLYLITFGSLLAFTRYAWLLQNAPISKVSTYAYVNPVVAIALGWLFLDEGITPMTLVGAGIIVASVALVVRSESPKKRADASASTMRIGIQLPEVEREVRWPEYLAMAKAAEEVGFESVWLGDHLLYDGPERAPWEAWTLMSALAAATERVRLGPLVACAGLPPAGGAGQDGGDDRRDQRRALRARARARAGTGASSTPSASRTTSACRRFEEAFAIIRGLLAGERVTLDGTFHRPTTSCCCPSRRAGRR